MNYMKRTSPQPLSSSWAAPWTPFSTPSMTAALGEGARSESQEPCWVPGLGSLLHTGLQAGAEALVQHLLRVLIIYMHVMDDVTPSDKATVIPQLMPQPSFSPIRVSRDIRGGHSYRIY